MKVTIIGEGNVGTHLHAALQSAGHDVGLTGYRASGGQDLCTLCQGSELVILCLKDDMIPEASGRLRGFSGLVAHTSGTYPLDSIPLERKGVFYPLQTFTKGVEVDFSRIPILVEGNERKDVETLAELGRSVSSEVMEADGETRRKLHLAAVFACNFVNHLWGEAYSYLKENGLDFSLLRPLIEETFRKGTKGDPSNFQTGPAARNDTGTIERHRKMLAEYPGMEKEYELLTEEIIKRCRKQNTI